MGPCRKCGYWGWRCICKCSASPAAQHAEEK